jgi:hypothetical protein
MREESPGVYVGSYVVRRGDSLTNAPVTVIFTASGANGRTVTQTAPQPLTIAAGPPDTPVIDTPQEDAQVSAATITVAGRAAPNATVRVQVAYSGRALLLLTARGTLVEREVKADAQGRWRLEDVRLSAPSGVSNVTYTLTAVSVDANGNPSEPATVRFRR